MQKMEQHAEEMKPEYQSCQKSNRYQQKTDYSKQRQGEAPAKKGEPENNTKTF